MSCLHHQGSDGALQKGLSMVSSQGHNLECFCGREKLASEGPPGLEVESLGFVSQMLVMFCFDDVLLLVYCDS